MTVRTGVNHLRPLLPPLHHLVVGLNGIKVKLNHDQRRAHKLLTNTIAASVALQHGTDIELSKSCRKQQFAEADEERDLKMPCTNCMAEYSKTRREVSYGREMESILTIHSYGIC